MANPLVNASTFRPPTVLLTGFEPFGGRSINTTERLVGLVAALPPRGVRMVTGVLPVDGRRVAAALIGLLEEHRPDVAICLGESHRPETFAVERVAVNLADYRIADNSGWRAQEAPIAPDGPAAYFSTLPVRGIVEAVRAGGCDASVSLSAGAYLCNHAFYVLMHELARSGRAIPAGFIHVARLPAAGEKPDREGLPTEEELAGAVRRAVEVATAGVARPSDVARGTA
jgi:pyroglutamyl-peptidase